MTRQEVLTAILTGIDAVRVLKEQGYRLSAVGEMGIGNTTTSSAVASVLLQKDPELVTGAGAGLDSAGLKRKQRQSGVESDCITRIPWMAWRYCKR